MSRAFLSNGVTIIDGQVLGNQETILANRTGMEGDQSKRGKILADQQKVLAEKERTRRVRVGWAGCV